MPKRIPDMITAATARKVKNMSMPELNCYLYAIYRAGYEDGLKDGPELSARIAALAATTEEAAPDGRV